MDRPAAVEQITGQVWNQVKYQVVTRLSSQVGVGSQVSDHGWNQVTEQITEQVWSTIGSQIRSLVCDQAAEDTNGSTGSG